MTYWLWIVFVITIMGVVLNIKQNKWCFVLWAGTNFVWMIVDYQAGIFPQAAKYAVFFALAIWGLISWAKKKK